ncbi:MAG: SDR family NAD(P)-dependent oxidoreductase [Eubacterium sp.]|nr:SDR family NAD(P)-dependent oxidoreductase [Eubacterium sp.]
MKEKRRSGWAVITGATSGIGFEFTRQLAQQGYNLLLVARRGDRLYQMKGELKEAGVNAEVLMADLVTDYGRNMLIRWMENHRVDVFINNAGFGLAGPFLSTETEREVQMIDLNVTAMHLLMKAALRSMAGRGVGYVLNVASSAGLLPGGPYMATYYATKAYVASLTQAVAEELRLAGSRIYVGCLCPGPVDTEFNSVAEVQFALKGITPKRCVAAALQGMKKRKVVIVPTLTMKGAVIGGRLLPRKKAVQLTAKQQIKKTENDPDTGKK